MPNLGGLFKGSMVMTLARLVASACAFVLFWAISQKSVHDLGAFRTVFIFFLFTEFLPLLGMNQYLIRECAVNRALLKAYLVHALVFAWLVCLFLIPGLMVTAKFGLYSRTVSIGLVLVAAGLPATAATLCLQSMLIGLGRGAEFGILQGIETLMRTVLGLFLIYFGRGILSVAAAFILVRWVIVVPYWRVLRNAMPAGPWVLERAFFLKFIRQVPVFAGILILFLIIRFAAQTMLPWMKGDAVAGQFAAAYQFLDLALLVPTAFAINLMPLFAQKARSMPGEPAGSCRQAIKLMATTILPGVVLVSALAGPLMGTVFGADYRPAVPVLEVLIWAVFFYSLDQVLSTALIAAGGQRMDFCTLAVGSLAILSFLYPLISKYEALGAAWGLFLGVLALVVGRLILVRTYLPRLEVLRQIWRPGAGAAMMYLIMQVMVSNWAVRGAAGIAAYLLTLTLLGAFNPTERAAVLELLRADGGHAAAL